MSEVAGALGQAIEHDLGTPGLMVLASMAALLATAGFHTWWVRRHGHAPPAEDTGARPPSAGLRAGPSDQVTAEPGPDQVAEAGSGDSALWRMRTTVRDAPGSLAVLCAALADRRVDILSLQTHPLADGTVDEFLLRAPGGLSGSELAGVVSAAGVPTPGPSGPTPTTWSTRRPGSWGWPPVRPWTPRNCPWHCVSCWAGARSGRCPPEHARTPGSRRKAPSRAPCCDCGPRRAG